MSHTVLLSHPSGREARVGVGFSWPALLFGPFWAMVRRQWTLALLLAIAFVGANVLAAVGERSGSLPLLLLSLIVLIGYMAACGLYGNRWLRYFLERDGYREEPETSP